MDFGSYLDVCSHFDDDWADDLPEEYFTTKGKSKGTDKAPDCPGSKAKGQSSSTNPTRSSNTKLDLTKSANAKGSKRKCQSQATNAENLEDKGGQAIPMLAGTSSAIDTKMKEESLLAINTSMESNEDRPLPSPTCFEDGNSVSSCESLFETFECNLPSSPVDDRHEPVSPVEVKPEVADPISLAIENDSRETAINYAKNAIVSQNVTPSSVVIPLPEFVTIKEEINEYKLPVEDIDRQQPKIDAVKGKGKAKKRKHKIIFGDSIKGATQSATAGQPAPPKKPRNVFAKKEKMNSVDLESLPHCIEQPPGLMAVKSGIQISEEERALLPTTTSNWTEYDKHFTYECDKCVASDGSGSVLTLKTYAEMYAHVRVHHKGGKIMAKCCGKIILSNGMSNHIRFHQEFDVAGDLITCRKCNITFPKDDLQTHKNEKHYKQLCELCGKDVTNKSQHMMVYHSEKNLPCPECGKVVKTEYALYVHRWNVHNFRKRRKPGVSVDLTETSYLCDHCGYSTTKKQALKTHIQNVHGLNRDGSVAKVQCPDCPKIFKSKVHLKVHMSSHSTTPNYQCRFCACRFNWGSDCYKHQRLDHPEEYALWKAQRMGSNAEKRDEGVKVQQTKSGPNTDIT